jgi:hypothetical protein
MLAAEDDSHFELEAEITILKRTCTRVSSFLPNVSNVEAGSTNRQAITTFGFPLNTTQSSFSFQHYYTSNLQWSTCRRWMARPSIGWKAYVLYA